jgi:hypothetical protein
MTYRLRVRYRSNEAPWSGGYEPAPRHQPADDAAAIAWAQEMSSGLGRHYVVDLYRDLTRVPIPETIERCVWGKCACASAAACAFPRCDNCDRPVDAAGRTVIDHSCDEWDTCPDCGGPLVDHHVYGVLEGDERW